MFVIQPSPVRVALSCASLVNIAGRHAARVDAGELVVSPHERHAYRRLVATSVFEAWLIAWRPLSGLALHDHGDSRGAIAVAHGVLAERLVDPEENPTARTRYIDRAEAVAILMGRAHEVWNPSKQITLSVHVFSPPVDVMKFCQTPPVAVSKIGQQISVRHRDSSSVSGGPTR